MIRCVLALWMAMTAVAFAEAPVCGIDSVDTRDPLTKEKRDAVLSGRGGGDPVVVEGIFLQHVQNQEPRGHSRASVKITWEQVRKIILLGAARTIVQSGKNTVQITTRSGQRYVGAEPEEDDAHRLLVNGGLKTRHSGDGSRI
jgi:hypothetical protein